MITFPRSLSLRILAGSVACLLPAHGAEITKANNTNALNDGTSWVGGVVPGSGDVALFNNTLTGANTSPFGDSLDWDGFRVTDPAGPVILANTDGATFSLGASGIDMSVATAPLLIEGAFAVTADQTWNVANASTAGAPFAGGARQFNNNEDLAFNGGNTSGTGIFFDLGGHAVSTIGAGTIVVTSGYFISNGTINVGNTRFEIQGGASKITTIDSFVTFNVAAGSELMYQSTSGGVDSSAPVNLDGGTLRFSTNNADRPVTQIGNVTVNQPSTILVANQIGGNASTSPLVISGNLIGSADLAFTNTAAVAGAILRLEGDNSGYSGTATFGGTDGRSTRMTIATAGSRDATWIVNTGHTLEIDGVDVELGTIGGGGTISNSAFGLPATLAVGGGTFSGTIQDGSSTLGVTKFGSGRANLTGSNFYSGPTKVDGGLLFLTPNSFATTAVTVADGATFGVQLTDLGGTLTIPSLNVGTTAGGTVAFDLGVNANPAAALLSAATFNPVAPTVIQVSGANLGVGTFPLLDYNNAIGGVGFAGLSLVLPPRVLGSLIDNAAGTSIDLSVTGQDFPKWTGAVDGNWDIDDGGGTGTANWQEVTSGNATKYIQTPAGSDSVLFDDSATGPTTVNLTTTLTPTAVTVNNSTQNYVFTGSGALTGSMPLIKNGTGSLIIRNTGANTYEGPTSITSGTVEIGDGVTAGAGSLGTGALTLEGALVLNRPDDFSIGGPVTGAGTLTKRLASTVSFPSAVNLDGSIVIEGGALKFDAGATLPGVISGAGGIVVNGSTVFISGDAPNTFAGMTSVTAGVLNLNKNDGLTGMNAIGGDLSISGTGSLQVGFADQIPDTASLFLNSDGPNTVLGNETIANATISGPFTDVGQLIANTGFVATGTVTINGRVFATASNHSATVGAIVLTGGTVRIAANSGDSTLNVGSGGIMASGGLIQVGQGVGAFNAVMNLEGDFTATADIEIARGNFQGFEKREIDLIGDRTFNIADTTTTTVRPEVAGTGGLVKDGLGTLRLLGASTYTGDTTVNAGTLATSTLQTGTANVTVNDGATLSVAINSAAATFNTDSLTIGSATGATIAFDIGNGGNPTAPIISSTALTAVGNSVIQFMGFVAPGTFSLIDYTGAIGGAGFSALSVTLPPRVAGNLVDNAANSSVDLQILGLDAIRWNGTVNADWDIDTTANWKGTISGADFTYLQTPTGNDAVLFNDDATGPTAINIVTTVSPLAATVDSNSLDYEFGGTGAISGPGTLTKSGTSTLTVLTENSYTGGTIIEGGIVNVGGGTAAGSLGSGPIANDGSLIFDRTSNITLNNFLSGTGTLTKRGAGELVIQGTGVNTNTGLTTVESGILRLNRTPGNDALGGDIVLDGGNLTWSQADQLADTASITVENGVMNIGNRAETLANLTIHDGRIQNFSGSNITGVLTVTTGIKHDAVNSGGTTTANQAILSNTILFLGANGGDSTLNIGAGGISFTDATISFGSLGNSIRRAVVNLDGDVTSAGESAFFVNSGTPISELNLGFATRTFNVTDGTLRVDPAVAGFGVGITKTGPGTLTFAVGTNTNGDSTYTGPTTVQEGIVLVNGSLTGTTVTVETNGTLGGIGTINGDVIVNGTLAPGDPLEFFLATLTLGSTDLTFGADGKGAFELDGFIVDQVLGIDQLTLDGTITVTLTNGFQPIMNDSFDLFDFNTIVSSGFDLNADLVLPALNPGLQWDRSDFLTEGVLVVVPEPLSSAALIAGLGLLAGLRRRRR